LDTLIALAGNRLYYHNDLYLACSCNRESSFWEIDVNDFRSWEVGLSNGVALL
jgi:hypothetical protein